VQNIDLFPNAEIVLGAAELESISAPEPRDQVTPAWTRHLFADARVRTVRPDEEVTPGLIAVDASGHTAGSTAYAIERAGEVSLVTGDALPYAEVARQRTSALVFWDVPKADTTVARLTDLADVLYPGHDRPFRLTDGEIDYQLPFEMTMFGAGPDTPGMTFLPPNPHRTIDVTDGEPVGPLWTRAELEF
jgi:glyoxylase-like metal-dependent hydrolase (beta-lactamase superfamily II)